MESSCTDCFIIIIIIIIIITHIIIAVGWAAEAHPACKKLSGGVLGCWHGYLSGVRCRLAYGPAEATATHCLLLQ